MGRRRHIVTPLKKTYIKKKLASWLDGLQAGLNKLKAWLGLKQASLIAYEP